MSSYAALPCNMNIQKNFSGNEHTENYFSKNVLTFFAMQAFFVF